jgi:allophanate hydrolase
LERKLSTIDSMTDLTDAPVLTTGPGPTLGPSISMLRSAYRTGTTTPEAVVRRTHEEISRRGADGVWITVAELPELLRRAEELMAVRDPDQLPLYGVPFGVKDSIDIAGWPTTLACPAYSRVATETAPVVQRLLDAGAILVGKTNLDQFATGLNGTRTAYPVPTSVYGQGLISGGSSSGSAVAVALGEVPFAVATDTAGSGRVPPALNGVVGFKPSRGLISTTGLVPACRSLDCVSLIGGSVEDLALVFDVVAAPDSRDPWSRHRGAPGRSAGPRVGLPDESELDFFSDDQLAVAHRRVRARIRDEFDAVVTPPLRPFLDAGALLYQGPWVAERLVEFGDFLDGHPGAVLPVVEQIIRGGARFSAVDVFRAQYRLAELKARVAELWQTMDVLVLPTIGTTFTVDQVLAEPISTNTTLGHYTHFGNLLDLCAVAVPSGTTPDGRPVSTMVLGPALSDDTVLAFAARIADRPVRP